MKAFLFANVPLSMLHFILFLIFGGFLAFPGDIVRHWRINEGAALVVRDGPQFPRLGCRFVPVRIPLHSQSA